MLRALSTAFCSIIKVGSMEHFVSIILADYELDEHLVESVLDSAGIGLLESETLYETFESEYNEQVLRVQMPRQLTIEESDNLAESLAHKLFEAGYENFDIEVSAEEDLPFDITSDLHVFMKNDPMFYRRVYYPTILKIADHLKQKRKLNFSKVLSPMIDKALDVYCKKFDLPQSTKKHFTQDSRKSLIDSIRDEEMQQIRQGEY